MEAENTRLEEQHRQAQKVESIGRLAGGIAHDLNNLLTPILGYSEMLLEKLHAGDERRESVDEIVKAGMAARDLVRQLLAFSRKQTLDYRALDLNDLIAGFQTLLRGSIREDIEIKIIPSPDIRTIQADAGQIKQVIMNLTVNAQDAMPVGGRMTIQTGMVDLNDDYAAGCHGVSPGEYVVLTVSDTGCGMDDETIKHIFEPFFSTKGILGTGLGLATVYGIVKQHEGNILADSELGKGTIFTIYLPVSGDTTVGKAPEQQRKDEEAVTNLRGSETILLAEDNDQLRTLARTILERASYTVLLAEDGEAALAVIDQHDGDSDLLLTDVVMPGMNGRELFARTAEAHQNLKVLYMSGYTHDMITHRGVLDKDLAFLQKPFTVGSLTSKVRQVLDQS